jgi:hypothetical protein
MAFTVDVLASRRNGSERAADKAEGGVRFPALG